MNHRTLVIAEAGVNHNGSLDLARRLIDAAAEARADVVKFQTFRSESVISRHARKAEYQVTNTGEDGGQLEMVRKLELDEAAHAALIEHARARSIEFMSTPFDLESVDLLSRRFGIKRLKVPSGEITNLPLLLAVARSADRVIVSTGMASIGEVEATLAALAFGALAPTDAKPTPQALRASLASDEAWRILRERVTLLHCTTEYPAPMAEVNLRAMATLRDAFGLPVGYSDHTRGITIPVAAVALGAVVIEKHFTLDRTLPGPDHVASLEPDELARMVQGIRDVESALGDGIKRTMPSEAKNIDVARKSLVARRVIRRGEPFDQDNLTTKRPGSGVSAMHYYEYLGRAAKRDYAADELIED